MRRMLAMTLGVVLWTALAAPAASAELYRIVLVQAAPGALPDLMSLYKQWIGAQTAAGEGAPLWFRHSQGDNWDLMLVVPVGSLGEYYQPARVARREKALVEAGLPEADLMRRVAERVAWQETLYADGPHRQALAAACDGAGLFHVEMMIGLPGRREEMRRLRERENAYLAALSRPPNAFFARRDGAAWDLVTLGCYRDLKHFAESVDIPAEKTREAARAAGHESPDAMSLAWRATLALHRDTLGVAIR